MIPPFQCGEGQVNNQNKYEQNHAGTQQCLSMQVCCVTHFHNDICCQCTYAAEDALWHYCVVAGKLRTVFRIVLPSAVPGILAGVILAVGRIVGETAALLYPAGTATTVADGLMSSGRTLAVHMYALLNEGLYMDQAYATAVVLLVVVIGINALSGLIAKKVGVKD